ncbi:MAG: glycosyltransferase [bacterium]|nr:glycosyltransferase [bacterium]
MKVALVTDWMYGGGGERVVEAIHQLYPKAPIYTSYCSDEWRQKLNNQVVTGYLQRSPFKQLRRFLPVLRQWWFRQLNLSKYDLVISITGNGEAKFVSVPNGTHVSYCHTPVHFYWRHYEEYVRNPSFHPKWLARLGLKMLVKPLRQRDYTAAQKVDYFIANSNHIKSDINKFYDREAVVIHPPIDVDRFANAQRPAHPEGYITIGRQVPIKKIDVIIQACNELEVPLTVIGNGPEHDQLVAMSGPNIIFKTEVSDKEMPKELAQAQAFLFAAFEDFGIAPVEAMATGLPVIAFKAGGALDYVISGKTGEFFPKQTADSLKVAMQGSTQYNREAIKQHTASFSVEIFKTKLRDFVAASVS